MGFFLSSWPSPASALHWRAVASALPFSLFVLGEVCTAGSGMGEASFATGEGKSEL